MAMGTGLRVSPETASPPMLGKENVSGHQRLTDISLRRPFCLLEYGSLAEPEDTSPANPTPQLEPAPMKRLIQIICNALAQGENLILATIVTAPDQPRLVGERMLIRANGKTHGTIGGGLLEAETLDVASRMFLDQTHGIQLVKFCGETSPRMQSPCGSGTTVLIEPITATGENLELFRKLLDASQNGIKCCILTDLGTNSMALTPLHRELVHESHRLNGESPLRHQGISILRDKASSVTSPAIETLGKHHFFLNPWIVPYSVYLFGAGHVAQEVAELATKAGFRTVVLDDREKFANEERFPMADEIIVLDSFDNAFRGLDLDSESHVVIVTRGHRHEKNLLRQALASQTGYIGVIGSIRKRDVLFREMSSEGFSIDDLLRIYCPIGVYLMAESPLEIAVSIIAQLIHRRAEMEEEKKLYAPLSSTGETDLKRPAPAEQPFFNQTAVGTGYSARECRSPAKRRT